MSAQEAKDRIRKTLSDGGFARDQPGKHVRIRPADVVALCDAIAAAQHTQVVKDLLKGTSALVPPAVGPAEAAKILKGGVWILSDDAFHLLEEIDAQTPAPAA